MTYDIDLTSASSVSTMPFTNASGSFLYCTRRSATCVLEVLIDDCNTIELGLIGVCCIEGVGLNKV
jgi:hypothetical protein